MFWTTKKTPEKLLAHYLDPGKDWSVADDKALREWAQSSDEARNTYGKRVLAHRLMLGLDSETPSRVEQDRMRNTTVARSMGDATPDQSFFSLQALAPLGAALLVLVVAVPALMQDEGMEGTKDRYSSPPSPSIHSQGTEYLGTRGGEGKVEARAAIGLAGVRASDNTREYEVLHQQAYLADRLRFSYRCTDSTLNKLFLFGEQDGEIIWYFPLPSAGEKESISVSCATHGSREQIEGDTALKSRHKSGKLKVYGIFTEQPLSLEEVERALAGNEISIQTLRDQLPLDAQEVIHTLEVNIQEGGKEEAPNAR